MKARKTTFEERVTIVEYYLNHKQSYREVAEHFNILIRSNLPVGS
ncbi:insertion element protein [Staphylococcus aureus]|nr:insertion element protein [Staphylococcus aureus]